jgi:hypothetical protein
MYSIMSMSVSDDIISTGITSLVFVLKLLELYFLWVVFAFYDELYHEELDRWRERRRMEAEAGPPAH